MPLTPTLRAPTIPSARHAHLRYPPRRIIVRTHGTLRRSALVLARRRRRERNQNRRRQCRCARFFPVLHTALCAVNRGRLRLGHRRCARWGSTALRDRGWWGCIERRGGCRCRVYPSFVVEFAFAFAFTHGRRRGKYKANSLILSGCRFRVTIVVGLVSWAQRDHLPYHPHVICFRCCVRRTRSSMTYPHLCRKRCHLRFLRLRLLLLPYAHFLISKPRAQRSVLVF